MNWRVEPPSAIQHWFGIRHVVVNQLITWWQNSKTHLIFYKVLLYNCPTSVVMWQASAQTNWKNL